jgi:hypothetical protein
MKSLVALLCLGAAAIATAAEQSYDSGYEPQPPTPFPTEFKDYQILPNTISPNQRVAFIYPKSSRLDELEKYSLLLVVLKPFQTLCEIPRGNRTLEHKARGYYAATWSVDSSTAVFVVGGRWGPEKVWVVALRDDRVANRTELTQVVRQEVLPDYKKSHAGRYNQYYDFVFNEDHDDTSSWKLDDSGHVIIDTTCTTDPKKGDPHRWTVRFKGTWNIALGKLIQKSVSRIPPRPNQAMQLTSPRFVSPSRVARTFKLQPRALPGAVADLVSR